MNKQEIKNRIANLLGLKYYFGAYKTKEGVELKTEKEMMELESPIYVITPEGELPAPEGEYELDNGMIVKVKDGMIKELLTEKMEDKIEEIAEEKMVEATLVDGTKVTNDLDTDFEVGQALFVITEEGDKVPAPEGEHTTESGIVVVVDGDGKITGISKPDGEKEGSMDMKQVYEVLSQLVIGMEKLSTDFSSLKSNHDSLEQKFSKFSAEPAGEKIYTKKGFELNNVNTLSNKLEMFTKLKKLTK
jgi:hypothetical protein